MALYVVTGGAGFIGSHLVEDAARPRRARPRRRQPDHRPRAERRSIGRRVRRRATWPISTFASDGVAGADYVLHQAAIPSVPRSVQDPITLEPRQHRRDAERARRGARRQGEARRLRRVLVGLRQRRRAAEARGHGRPRRCRPTPCRSWWASSTCRCSPRSTGSRRCRSATSTSSVRGRIPSSPYSGVISLFITAPARRQGADDLRRRRPDARLHLRRQRRRRRAARLHAPTAPAAR